MELLSPLIGFLKQLQLGISSLHYAAQNGQADTVEVLLKAGLCKDARTKVDKTPLHFACQSGHLLVVQKLIHYGADINAKDMLRMSPLHWAVERGHWQVVRFLLSQGARISEINKFGKTPLDIANRNNRPDILRLLQSKDENQKFVEGHVVEEVASRVETAATADQLLPNKHIIILDSNNKSNKLEKPNQDLKKQLMERETETTSNNKIKLKQNNKIEKEEKDSSLEYGDWFNMTEDKSLIGSPDQQQLTLINQQKQQQQHQQPQTQKTLKDKEEKKHEVEKDPDNSKGSPVLLLTEAGKLALNSIQQM